MRLWLCALVPLTLALACTKSASGLGTGTGTNPDAGSGSSPESEVVSISINPQAQTLYVDGGSSVSQTYQVTGSFSDVHTSDVTAMVELSATPSQVGSWVGSTFTASGTQGGVVLVTGILEGAAAQATLTLVMQAIAVDPNSPGLPSSPGQSFNGPPDALHPLKLVYPYSGVVIPPNLSAMQFHFVPNPGETIFELVFQNGLTQSTVFFTCDQWRLNGGCAFTPPTQFWTGLANTNRGSGPMSVIVKGSSGPNTSVAASAPISIEFAPDDILGAIYYWTTTNNSAIMRFDFGQSQTQAQTVLAPSSATDNQCVGCHALSRDGSKMVAELDGQNDGRLVLFDVATGQRQGSILPSHTSIFESWNPDGSQFVGVYGDSGSTDFNLLLFDGSNPENPPQDIQETGSSTHPADHPDWSADGNSIVFTSVGPAGSPRTNQRFWGGAIHMVSNGTGTVGWGAPVELVPAMDGGVGNRYYPAFAPDSSMVVFCQSICPLGNETDVDCDADSDPSATLYAVAPLPGAQPVALANANQSPNPGDTPGRLTNSFPKWSPFTGAGVEGGSKLMWMTFSSTRNYGLLVPPPPAITGEAIASSFLWMVAVDPAKLSQGLDPSYPPFVLPVQQFTTSNHIGQWTEHAPGCASLSQVCSANSACCTGLVCADATGNTCLDGASCSCIPEAN
jgi:WD40-like Beta Propeller Repeat